MTYVAAEDRYDRMLFRRCGRRARLPAITLGLWWNFGNDRPFEDGRAIMRRAFDLGITHFDLANNYGPPYGAAEENFGRMLATDFSPYRDELVISTKAGWDMWPGPYGDRGSRKYLLASLDQSLGRMGLDYVDIFYSHRPDPETPIEERWAPSRPQFTRARRSPGSPPALRRGQRKRRRSLRSMGAELLVHQPPIPCSTGGSSRATGCARGRGRRLHHVLPVGAGHADGQVPRGSSEAPGLRETMRSPKTSWPRRRWTRSGP